MEPKTSWQGARGAVANVDADAGQADVWCAAVAIEQWARDAVLWSPTTCATGVAHRNRHSHHLPERQ